MLEHGDYDKNFGPLNPGTGMAFKGLISNLAVYDQAFEPRPVRPASWGLLKLLHR